MFYGQIMMQGYLKDPSVSFCAVDDTQDKAPLQVTDFAQGVQMDNILSKIYLEGGGAGERSRHEAYELAAFFYLQQCDLDNSELPYFFITGDEHFYQRIKKQVVKNIMGDVPAPLKKEQETIDEINKERIEIQKEKEKSSLSFFSKLKNFFGLENEPTAPFKTVIEEVRELKEDEISSLDIFKALKKKFNVFHIHKQYFTNLLPQDELVDWIQALGEEWILELKTPKAVIDVILGVIALTSGSRTMDEYIKDMKARGQSFERIEEVKHSLRHLTPKFLEKNVLRFQKNIIEEKIEEKEQEAKNKIEEEKKEEI